ncbi:choice-of-anchor Q domain-containing protein [Desulfoluna sp.]|uniref:choice-of-anchor Q domain-containing protein n=1 Tax=Desulfoluna sp. TaxID=2045199 RepID=UPI002609F541|nr:choice-of-anchor Q domain-containing protein [Desulfoluna sp.]
MDLTNCTVSGNNATKGGGGIIDVNASNITILQSTITGNTTTVGGGGIELRASSAKIKNTILAANTGGDGNNFFKSGTGLLTSHGYNICNGGLSAFTATGDKSNATIHLAGLADNGGLTQTHALGAGSDAIDAIPRGANDYNGAPALDQRGTVRPQCSNVDVGAFERVQDLTVITQAATGVTGLTATGNGNITFLGEPHPTQHGVCWSTSANPTTTDSKTTQGEANVTGAFSCDITGLSPDTTYHYRAYATHTAGTVYGADRTFTTFAMDLTVIASNNLPGPMVLGNHWTWTVSIRNMGTDGAVFTDGQVILTDQLPDTAIDYGIPSLSNVITITNQGNIDAEITDNVLTVKASGGSVVIGGTNGRFDVNFTARPTGATSFSNPRSGGTCTVDPNNYIIEVDEGNNTPATDTVTVVGPDLSVTKSNDKGGSIVLGDHWTWRLSLKNTGNADAVFTDGQTILTDDLPNTNINYATPTLANLTNPTHGDHISAVISGNTLTVSALGARVTLGAVTGGFDVELQGTPTVEGAFVNPRAGGICTVDPDRLITESDETNNTATDTVIVASLPVVITQSGTAVTKTTGTGKGKITSLGSPPPTGHGVCWSTTVNPIISDNKTDKGATASTGDFTAAITGLSPGTTYHVRAFATNLAGTVYGADTTFATPLGGLTAPLATISNTPEPTTNAKSYRMRLGGIGVVSYRFSLDKGPWSQEMPIAQPLTFNLAVGGSHSLSVTGKNCDGVWQPQTDATVFKWTLDNTPPRAVILNPPSGTVGATSVRVTVGGADVTAYRYRLDSGGWSRIHPVSTWDTISDLGEGDHTLEVIGVNGVGNWQKKSAATHVSWHVTPGIPTVVLTEVPGIVTDRTSAKITVGTAKGSPSIEDYYYSIDGGVTWDYGRISEPIALNGLAEGNQTLFVNGFGNDGWQGGGDGMTTENATSCKWRVDLTPPDPVVLDAAKGTPSSTTVNLSWRSSSEGEPERIQNYLIWYSDELITEENLANATAVFCDMLPWNADTGHGFTLSGLGAGETYYFAVKSVDPAGNVSALSHVVDHTTEDMLPEITGMALVAGGTSGDNSVAREIAITGANFLESAGCNRIRFENKALVFDVSANHGTQNKISAIIPEGAPEGSYALRVINKNGISRLFENAYTVNKAPTPVPEVIHLSPTVVIKDISYEITLTGRYFADEIIGAGLVGGDNSLLWFSDTVRIDSSTIKARLRVPSDFAAGRYTVQVIHSNGDRNNVSAAMLEVCEVIHLSQVKAAVKTMAVVTTDDGVIPFPTTLITDNRDEVAAVDPRRSRIEAQFDAGTVLEENRMGDWKAYTGRVDPPRQIPMIKDLGDKIGKNSILFSMGADRLLRLKYGKTLFVKMDITLPASEPVPAIYYVAPDGSISIAGVHGSRGGMAYPPGGKVLATRHETPEPAMTTYTIGILLDHMSTYAVGSYTAPDFDPDPDSGHRSGEGGCFIGTTRDGRLTPGDFVYLYLTAKCRYSRFSQMGMEEFFFELFRLKSVHED